MGKKNNKKSMKVSKKPKHSLDVNNRDKSKSQRSAATVKRLRMYNNRPVRNNKGRIVKHDFQSKNLPSTRIMPDRRWFLDTKVISQEKLESFREAYYNHRSSSYNVILNEGKLPVSLLNDDHQKTMDL